MIDDHPDRIGILLRITAGAALTGSVAGAAIAVPLAYALGTIPFAAAPLLLVLIVALLGGYLLAFVAVLVIGLPLAWPMRTVIARHPNVAALAYGTIGALLSGLILPTLGGDSPFEASSAPAFIYGATTAMAVVLEFWRWGDRGDSIP